MKALVIVGFSEPNGTTHLKGETVDLAEAYVTKLVERGRVQALGDTTKASKSNPRVAKASRKNERKNL